MTRGANCTMMPHATSDRPQRFQGLCNLALAVPLNSHDLIYVAIGCSQKWYQSTGTTGSSQEYPPFVAAWPGRKLCILIDPDLEESPVGIVQAGGAPTPLPDCKPHNVSATTVFLTLRTHFRWRADEEGSVDSWAFLNSLVKRAVDPAGPHMIVQDYSGPDIRPYYPLDRFGHALLPKVLFDMTGGDAGCFVDFSKYRLLRDPAGHFVQPHYTPLWKLKALRIGKAYEDQIRDRYALALDSAARCWRAQNGHDEPRDWYAPALVAERIRPLLYAYGINPQLATGRNGDPLIPFAAVEEPLFDFCATAGTYMCHEEIYSLATGDFDQLRNSFRMLRDLVLADQKEGHQ